MRHAVELLDLSCSRTRDSEVDNASLMLNGKGVWSGHLRNGTKTTISTIRPLPEPASLWLWQADTPHRTISLLGREPIKPDVTGTRTAHFTRDGADYTLSYKVLEIPD